jgi:hypothetical protein
MFIFHPFIHPFFLRKDTPSDGWDSPTGQVRRPFPHLVTPPMAQAGKLGKLVENDQPW